MSFFTSAREKQLWLYVLIVLITIISTLFFGQPLIEWLSNQNIQAAIFLLAMLLVGTSILIHGLTARPSKTEMTIWIGFSAVYLLLFLRLGLPERSHLIEYSVLAIFIHKALIERVKGKQILMPAFLALVITIIIGMLDECIQILLPNRVFDPVDILFNSLAGLLAIGASIVLHWVRKKING